MELWVLDILFYTGVATVCIPLTLLIATFNRQPIEYRWLAAILALSFTCDTVAEILYRLGVLVNYSSSVWSICNPVLFAWFFYFVIGWKKLKPVVIIVTTIYFVFSVLNLLFVQKFEINTYSNIVGKLITMSFSIVYYYKLLKEMPTEKIYRMGIFLIVSSYFFTSSANLVTYSFAEYLIKIHQDNLISLWSMHNAINIIGNLVIGWGVWIHIRQMNRRKLTASASPA
jgi:hypothetical protein